MNSKTASPWRSRALVYTSLALAAAIHCHGIAQGAPGTISSIAGTEGCGNLTADPAGNLYIDDDRGLQKLDVATGRITTVAGRDLLISGAGIAVDPSGDVYISQGAYGPLANTVKKIAAGTQTATTYAGTGEQNQGLGNRMPGPATKAIVDTPNRLALDADGNLYISHGGGVWKVTSATGIINGMRMDFSPMKGAPALPPAGEIKGMIVDAEGNLYLADERHSIIWKVSLATGKATPVAGTGIDGFSGDGGPATTAQLNGPNGLAVDNSGNLYIADLSSNRIRKVASDGMISTVAGNGTYRKVYAHVTLSDGNTTDRYQKGDDGDGGPATNARISSPVSVAIDHAGNLYICQGILRKVQR